MILRREPSFSLRADPKTQPKIPSLNISHSAYFNIRIHVTENSKNYSKNPMTRPPIARLPWLI